MTPADTSAPAGARAAIQWRKVMTLTASQALSLTGDYVLLVALGWTAVQLGGAGAITTLMLAGTLPRALTLVFSGPVTDMLGPRFVLLRTTSARALLLAAGAAVTLTTGWFWPLVVIAAIEGVLLGMGSPASQSLMPRLAEGDQLARANSLSAMVTRLAPIVGAPIGAWMIATGELWVAMAAVSVTCAVSFVGVFVVTRGMAGGTRTPGENMLRRSGDGLRLLRSQARLRWLFICAFCLDMAFGWPIDVALPLLVDGRGWGVGSVAVVVVAFSAGALFAGTMGALLAHRIPLLVRLVFSGVGIGVGILLMALMPSVTTLAAVGAGVGLMAGLNGPAIVTVYQQASPRARLGTAMSMLTLASIGTTPVSIVAFGALSAVIGVTATWLVCGVVALAAPAAALMALRQPVPATDAAEPATPADATQSATPAGSAQSATPAGSAQPSAAAGDADASPTQDVTPPARQAVTDPARQALGEPVPAPATAPGTDDDTAGTAEPVRAGQPTLAGAGRSA
ncbi:MFS transporter [Micromonospora cathayae]|uniref:MFS transporter n=1 Tax=Micromonospora cathayae TaxID=3028804 RepID=A0ABY7ZKK7_9ACTN|nr:MFS transporter [Micromonospora sp. HUAS 3]WDZ83417.1 MFS transporter [Micromonospora sp. HUAS 3]